MIYNIYVRYSIEHEDYIRINSAGLSQEIEYEEDNNTDVTKILFNQILIEKEYSEPAECPICFECIPKDKYIKTNCHHEFCSNCIYGVLFQSIKDDKHKMDCPMCRCDINEIKVYYIKTELMY
jgi:hypothetical protein